MVPVPPCQRGEPVGDIFRKPPPDHSRRVSRDDGVGRDVLGHDGACRDHRAGADAAAWQHDRAVPDPDIMTDVDAMAAPPFEELCLVAFAGEISAGAIREVRLRGPVHGMIPRVDPRHRRNRAKLSDRRVGDLRVVHDVGIVVHRYFLQDCSRANLAIGTEPGVVQFCGGIDRRFNGKRFAGHANFRERWILVQEACTSSMGLMTAS